ncbi:MAG TPA: SpoIIE family protein phosphatase [Spirochaetota bacterium]|mgnify:CR=1 FL=1|nr:SpoIIE family protein phosphatase [Spirochaetota bacterium]HPI89796.1 SpoIIE family protein phosphatase [Spirochaetota bacterium]HPR47563.1 SpoIIE family protein phosphatase [Spirochaetota bacterium]
MAKKASVRKIRFGIRLKISIIMILGIAFASSLIGLAVYNQHENKIKETILQLSGTILKGASDNAETYLRITQFLSTEKAAELNRRQKTEFIKKIDDSQKEMTEYFSSIIKKEDILDIAFLIDIDWKDINVNWNRRDQARYKYFSRNKGELFELDLYTKQGSIIKGGRGRDDAQLKPTIFSYYMQNVDTSSYLAFSEGRKDEGKHFVIVGMPLFTNRNNVKLYDDYLAFKKTRIRSAGDVKKIRSQRESFRNAFLYRIISGGPGIEYDLVVDTGQKEKVLLWYLINAVDTRRLSRDRLVQFRRAFSDMIKDSIEDKRLPLFRVKVLLNSMAKEYGLSLKNDRGDEVLWRDFYHSMRRNAVAIETAYTVDDLALVSFRMDLSGVLGLFLLRDSFYSDMQKDRKEIINLIISIFLRATIIALFFPTFIIRSVNSLQEAALEIGKGNLGKRIDIKGSDELGRLADIINIMATNLSRAQQEMLEKQRMQEELKTAQHIQSALLPAGFPSVPGLSFGAYYMAQSESGGDYYDFIDLGSGKLGLAMADVSGHGVASGLVMAMTRTLLHVYCREITDTKKILELINTHLYENTASNYFVTMFYGVLDLKSLQVKFSSAGHNPGIIVRREKIIEIPAGGIALGATTTDTMSRLTDSRSLQLQKGDYFVQYTDGVYESFNANGEEYGSERFHAVLLDNCGKEPADMIKNVVKSIDAFTGKVPQHDDITFFVIRVG